MKQLTRLTLITAIALSCAIRSEAVLTTNTIFDQNFDSDIVGQLPSGWTGLPTVNANAFVTNSISKSAPNSFEHTFTAPTSYDVQTTFPGFNLNGGDPDQRLSYALDVNVANIDNIDSQGFNFRIYNGVSQIDVGTPRILRSSADTTKWRFFNGLAGVNGGSFYVGSFNFNQWYNFRVVISPTSPSSGTADWYMDGALVNTETYSARSPVTQTSNIHIFDIRSVPNTGSSTMYVDNLLIQSIVPEPTSMALAAVGCFILMRRRFRGNGDGGIRTVKRSRTFQIEKPAMWSLFLALSVGAFFATSSHAQYSFFDTFDSEPVGSFPSTWTNVGPNAEAGFIVTNLPSAPTTPKVFQVQNPEEDFFQVWRQFPQTSLNTVSNVVIAFNLNVTQIPSGFGKGFVIVPGVLPTQGEETFSQMRVTSNTSGSSNTWAVINDYAAGISGGNGLITNGLALNTWYDFRFEIDPSPTNAETGVVRWYINNNLVNTETHYVAPPGRTNINDLVVRNAAGVGAITTFYLDNVRVYAEIPEPSSAALVISVTCGALIALRRQFRP